MAVSPTSSSDLYSTLGIGQQQQRKRATSGNDLNMDSFLTLMTAQMRNQDPTKPMDSAQYLGQLAQFASVKGLQQLDTRLAGMSTMMGEQQAISVSDLIGKHALIKSDTAELVAGGDKVIDGKFSSTGSGEVTVTVKDAKGNVVQTFPVQAAGTGDVDFEWNGLDSAGNPAAPGDYTFSAQLGATKLATQIASRIDSISYTANGIVLNLDGHDNVTFDQILSIE
jgi:flagellar basal-body rod modification protein FlgD